MSAPLTNDPRCACVHSDPHECYFHRYAPMDDLQRAEFETEMRATGDECECSCHGDDGYEDGEEDFLWIKEMVLPLLLLDENLLRGVRHMPMQLDPMLTRLRKLAGNGYEWLHDVADRLEQLQLPHADVLRIAEAGDDGADTQALMKALCKKVDSQRRRIAQLEGKKS